MNGSTIAGHRLRVGLEVPDQPRQGDRQWNTWLRVKAYCTLARGRTGWGAMVRIGYEIELPRSEPLAPGAVIADLDAGEDRLALAPLAEAVVRTYAEPAVANGSATTTAGAPSTST